MIRVCSCVRSPNLCNQELPLQKIQKDNPVIGFSKRVSINITNDANTGHWNLGDKVTQIVSNFTNTGRVSKIGGKLALGNTKLTVVSNTGIGLTDGTYVGVTLSSLTGQGEGAVADITVQDGAITAGVTTITTAGTSNNCFGIWHGAGGSWDTAHSTMGVYANPDMLDGSIQQLALALNGINTGFASGQCVTLGFQAGGFMNCDAEL